MTDQYMVVVTQIVGSPEAWSYSYTSDEQRFADRRTAIDHGLRVLGHDDFNIGTLRGDRLVEFGWQFEDFPPEDRDDLAEIERQLGIDITGEGQ